MTYIDYMGIAPESIELVNSVEFKNVLETYPNLRLVTTAFDEDGNEIIDEDGNEIFNEVSLPLPAGHDTYVGIEDRNDKDAFMWVLYDDCDSVTDPSPGFIAVLQAMDDFSVQTLNERLFMPKDPDLCLDDDAILEAKFDFAKGDYSF